MLALILVRGFFWGCSRENSSILFILRNLLEFYTEIVNLKVHDTVFILFIDLRRNLLNKTFYNHDSDLRILEELLFLWLLRMESLRDKIRLSYARINISWPN